MKLCCSVLQNKKVIFVSFFALNYLIFLTVLFFTACYDVFSFAFLSEGTTPFFICMARTGKRASILQPKCATLIYDFIVFALSCFFAIGFAYTGAKEENTIMLYFGFCISNVIITARAFIGFWEINFFPELFAYGFLIGYAFFITVAGFIASFIMAKFVFSWRLFTLLGGKTNLTLPFRYFQFVSTFATLDRQMAITIYIIGMTNFSFVEALSYFNLTSALILTIFASYILVEHGLIRNKWYWMVIYFATSWILPIYLIQKAFTMFFGAGALELLIMVDEPSIAETVSQGGILADNFALFKVVTLFMSGLIVVIIRFILSVSLLIHPCLYCFKKMDKEVFVGLYDRRCEPSCTKYCSRKMKCSKVPMAYCSNLCSNIRNDYNLCCLLPYFILIDTPTFAFFCCTRTTCRCLLGEYKDGLGFVDKVCLDSCNRAYPCHFYGVKERNKRLKMIVHQKLLEENEKEEKLQQKKGKRSKKNEASNSKTQEPGLQIQGTELETQPPANAAPAIAVEAPKEPPKPAEP